jgi:hypothetical protein
VAKDLTRRQKTDRAYVLLLASGGFGVGAVVALFVSGFGLFLLLAVVAAVCGYLFRRVVR